jgi:hypothetical protein
VLKAVEASYLGWRSLTHLSGCRRPSWEAHVREDEEARDDAPGGHSCRDEFCSHRDMYERTSVRLVCRSCGRAHVLSGEAVGDWSTTTSSTGHGMPPKRRAGLLLWPSQPYASAGRLDPQHPYPHDWFVTRAGVTRPVETDLVGLIILRPGPGSVRWTACADPASADEIETGSAMPVAGSDRWWTHTTSDCRSPGAAAKWIEAQLGGS